MFSPRTASLRQALAKEEKQKTKSSRALRIAALQDKDEEAAVELIDYGKIAFTQHNSGQPAEYILAKGTTDKRLVAKQITTAWKITEPGVMIRTVGSVNLKLLRHLDSDDVENILQGVLATAATTGGCLQTNGLNFGLASLLGACYGRIRHRCPVPLVGVLSWSSVQNREMIVSNEDISNEFVPNKGLKHKYVDGAPEEGAFCYSLQPAHTHFVFLRADKATLAASGNTPAEQLRNARIRAYKAAHDVEKEMAAASTGRFMPARVLAIFGGDEFTLGEIESYVAGKHGRVLLLASTGGLAQALGQFIKKGEIQPDWEKHREMFEKLMTMNHAEGETPKLTPNGRDSALEDEDWKYIAMTEVTSKEGIMNAILDLAMEQCKTASAKVAAAVKWNNAERLNELLLGTPPWDKDRPTLLKEALEDALKLKHTDCVKICIHHGAPVAKLDLLDLYDLLYDTASPPIIYLFKGLQKPSERLEQWRTHGTKGGRDSSVNLDDPIYEFFPVEAWDFIGAVTPGLCTYWRRKIGVVAQEGPLPDGGRGYMKLTEAIEVKKITGPKWIDIYLWAILLGETELALALLPACREPMRAAVIGAALAKSMADALPLHAVALQEAADEHEAYAIKLLDMCETFEDAWRMLITKSTSWTRPLMHQAVIAGLKKFAYHVHCQTLGDEWLYGRADFEQTAVVLNGTAFTTARMLLHAVVPFDPPFMRKMLKVVPSASGSDADVYGMTPNCWKYYTIPVVKLLVRFVMHLLYTLLLSFATLETPMPWLQEGARETTLLNPEHPRSRDPCISSDPTGVRLAEHDLTGLAPGHSAAHHGGGLENRAYDTILWIWTVASCLDEFYKYAMNPKSFQASGWNQFDYLTFAIVQLGLTVRFVNLERSVETECFAVILVWVRILKFLQLDYNLGVLVIILMRMTKDIVVWGVVNAIVLIAFTVAFVSIADPFIVESSGGDPMTAPLWAMLGDFDVQEYHDWNPSIGKTMLWLYVIFSNVVLVNLLIAMMGHTFETMIEEADLEWKFGRLQSIIECNDRFSAVPPPFNLPITLYAFLTFMYRKATAGTGETSKKALDEDQIAEIKVANQKLDKVAKRLLYSLKRAEEDATNMEEVGGDVKTIVSKQEYNDVQLNKRMDKMEGLMSKLTEVIMKGQHSTAGWPSSMWSSRQGIAEEEDPVASDRTGGKKKKAGKQ